MNILRIDDRLIHGQVIIGWLGQINFDKLILFHNDLPEDIIELYSNMLSGSIEFLPVNIEKDPHPVYKKGESYFLIARDLTILKRALEFISECRLDLLNIGGLRDSEGRTQLCDFIYLSKSEAEFLVDMKEKLGCRINARELPYSKEFDIIRTIEEKLL